VDFDFITKVFFALPPIAGLRALAAMRWGKIYGKPRIGDPPIPASSGLLGSFRNSVMGVEIFTPDNLSSSTL
jgi:hypothetical protein